jgi:hypothetical protein
MYIHLVAQHVHLKVFTYKGLRNMGKACSKVCSGNYILNTKVNECNYFKMDFETPSNDSHLYKLVFPYEYIVKQLVYT